MDQPRYLSRRIRQDIDDFRQGTFSFRGLVADTQSCISALTGHADEEWIQEWRSLWGHLEIVNAVMIDEKRSELTPEELSIVSDTLDAMRPMTLDYGDGPRDEHPQAE